MPGGVVQFGWLRSVFVVVCAANVCTCLANYEIPWKGGMNGHVRETLNQVWAKKTFKNQKVVKKLNA